MKKYQFTHIFNYSALQFTMCCIDAMHEEKINTDASKHLFVIRSAETYQKVKEKYPDEDNIILSISKKSLINQYARQSEWVFVHGFMSLFEIFYIFPWNLHRVVWRTWGSDAGATCYQGKPLVNCGKRILEFFRRPLIRRLPLIGLGSILDVIDLEERYGDVKMLPMHYKIHSGEVAYSIKRTEREHGIRVLIGHSGFSNDRHVQATEYLQKYKDHDIAYYYIFSYGDKQYMEQAEAKIKTMLGDKAVFIKENMPYDEYVAFLESMDLGVFLGEKSYALGNIHLLCTFRKWLLLSERGILAKAFSHYQAPYLTPDHLLQMDFETLEKHLKEENAQEAVLAKESFEQECENWNIVFNYLSKLKGKVINEE